MIRLRIIQINDVYELENFPYFKTLVEEMKQGPDKTLVVLAGDFLAPSLLSSLDAGRGMVDIMNACGITHVCLGNHETDVSMPDMAQRVKQSEFVWLNTNMRELDQVLDLETAPYDIVTVTNQDGGTKRVALLGLLTDDPSVYRPGSFGGATIKPIVETTMNYLTDQLPSHSVDLVIPLTHQSMPYDRIFCDKFTGNVFPIVLGGHDHEPYDETHSGARIIKTGHDAQNAAIIDITWNSTISSSSLSLPVNHDDTQAVVEQMSSSSPPTIVVEMRPTTTQAPDPSVQALVEGHKRVIQELEHAKIFRIADWMDGVPYKSFFTDRGNACGDNVLEDNDRTTDDATNHNHTTLEPKTFTTENNRLGPSTGSTILTSMLRMGMRAQCAIVNAGSIRANKTYPPNHEWFTWSDLKAEIPFATEMGAFYVPGRVLQDAIAYSRSGMLENPPVASGGYLHTCDQVVMDGYFHIRSIQGQPFDPDQQYLTAMPTKFLLGMDRQVPLLDWVQRENIVVTTKEDEMGPPAKLVIVQMFSALLWLHMGSFDTIDTNHDGVLSRDEIHHRAVEVFGATIADLVVDNVMSVADLHHKGYITPLDMMVVQFVACDMIHHICTREELCVMHKVASEVLGKRPTHDDVRQVVKDLRDILDISGNGTIQREEAMKILGEVQRRRSLLL